MNQFDSCRLGTYFDSFIVLSVFGLPWMCGATVQTVNHMRSMTKNKYNPVTDKLEIDSVVETRATGFVVHAMLASTVKLLPMLGYLPIPVVSGVFLYLGRKLMTGNTFLKRIRDTLVERKRLPVGHPVHVLGRKKVNIFTALQICCLWMLWGFKQNPNTAMFFPGVIGILIAIRLLVLPRFFTEKELVALGDPTP
jgi:solute carrier family 4 (anion exchanger) protein 1